MRKKYVLGCVFLAALIGLAIVIPKGIYQMQIQNCIQSYFDVITDLSTVQEISATVDQEGISEAYNRYWKDIMSYECWEQDLGNRGYTLVYHLADRGKKEAEKIEYHYFPIETVQETKAQVRVDITILWNQPEGESNREVTHTMFFLLERDAFNWKLDLIRV